MPDHALTFHDQLCPNCLTVFGYKILPLEGTEKVEGNVLYVHKYNLFHPYEMTCADCGTVSIVRFFTQAQARGDARQIR